MCAVIVGVDAGGTSTIAALSVEGSIVRTAQGCAANASARGVQPASDTIAQTIDRVLEGDSAAAIFVGAAGAGREQVSGYIENVLRSRFPGALVRVRDDACIALRAVIPQGNGLVLIAGTGSVAYAERNATAYRSGGYGYLFGDEGSGFALGSAAVKMVLRSFDERAPSDAFVREIAELLEARSAMDVVARIYGEPNAVTTIASLAPAVLNAANRGERSAAKIVQSAALELAEMTRSLAQRCGLAHEGAPIVLAGGLLEANSMLTYLLETRLKNELPLMPIEKRHVEPYVGALALAQALLS